MKPFPSPPTYCPGADRQGDMNLIYASALEQKQAEVLTDEERRQIYAAIMAYDAINPGYHISMYAGSLPVIYESEGHQSKCPRLENGYCLTKFPNSLAGDPDFPPEATLEIRATCRMLVRKLDLKTVIIPK